MKILFVYTDINTALFMFSRGCPYNCTFCSNHALRTKQEGRYGECLLRVLSPLKNALRKATMGV